MADRLESAIAEVYEAAASGRFFDLLPDIIARNAGARSCVVQKADRERGPLDISYSWFTPDMVGAYIRERIFLDDVWANCAIEHGIYGRTVDIGELTGGDRYTRSRFFQEFIRRFGDDTGHCVGAILTCPEGGILTYGAHRAARAETFRDEDIRLLDLLNPHILRAIAIDDRLGEGRRETDHARAVLERLERPVITMGPTRKVVIANPAAEAVVARGDGLLFTAGRLAARDPSSHQRLARAIGGALGNRGEQGGSLLIERGEGKPPYRLTIAPLAGNPQAGGVTHAMILIDDPDGQPPDAARRLKELYGFTGAEAGVAILVAQGCSTEEIAARREVGVATVKTLLQRCFRKSDTNRATQLARAVNRLPG